MVHKLHGQVLCWKQGASDLCIVVILSKLLTYSSLEAPGSCVASGPGLTLWAWGSWRTLRTDATLANARNTRQTCRKSKLNGINKKFYQRSVTEAAMQDLSRNTTLITSK